MADAREAFDVVAQSPSRFDLVITDQAMPRMTGLELARSLSSVRTDLPIVLYTGFGDQLCRLSSSNDTSVVRSVPRVAGT